VTRPTATHGAPMAPLGHPLGAMRGLASAFAQLVTTDIIGNHRLRMSRAKSRAGAPGKGRGGRRGHGALSLTRESVREALEAVASAFGIALSQGWLPVLAAGSDAYANYGDIGFVVLPLWAGYFSGAILALALGGHRRRGGAGWGSDGAALALGLFGLLVMIVTYTISQTIAHGSLLVALAAFAGCLLDGVGSVMLLLSWLTREGWLCVRAGRGVVVCVVSLVLTSLLVPLACALGHSVWTSLLNAVALVVSFILLGIAKGPALSFSHGPNCDAGGMQRPFERAVEGAGGASAGARPLMGGVVLGAVFSLMLGQFVAAPFGRALPLTWAFGTVGALVGLAVQLAFLKASGRWRPYLACVACSATMIIAFYPIRAGTEFSLHFAMAASILSLFAVAATAPLAVEGGGAKGADSALPRFLLGAVVGTGVCGPLGYLVALGPSGDSFVLASAIISMIAGPLSIAVLLRPLSASLDGDADVASAPTEPMAAPTVDDGRDLRCRELGEERGLTPREREVLSILAQGYDVARVQEELGISEGTALTHKRHVYQKLGVHTRTELLDLVRRWG
jgi:DNA-binding CsgD family transcriptional regulator